MQDLTPDMEDLLRTASDAYPLKQGEDKWDEIAARISTHPGSDIKKEKIGWHFIKHHLVLLFVLLFGFLYVNRDKNINRLSQDKGKSTAFTTIKNVKDPVHPKQIIPNKNLSINEAGIVNQIQAETKWTISEGYEIIPPNDHRKIVITGNLEFSDITYNNTQKLSVTRNDLMIPGFLNSVINEKSILTANNVNVNERLIPEFKSGEKNKYVIKGFYYGVVSGLHINAIKDQEFSKPGFDLGVLAGFHLGNRLSVESGLLLSKRSYWTTGKYFSKDGMVTMTSGMEIMELHGSNQTIEIPLHLRYDLFNRNRNRLFTSAGISSYIITNENNQYHTMYNGTEAMMYASYKKDRRYFAASVDVTVGYERAIGKKNPIRFEPYIQLPVRGVGVGLLPVKSYGVRLSLTRSLH